MQFPCSGGRRFVLVRRRETGWGRQADESEMLTLRPAAAARTKSFIEHAKELEAVIRPVPPRRRRRISVGGIYRWAPERPALVKTITY
jgi:hypothetical protein